MSDLSLPVLTTSFIGRDEEMQQIVNLLHEPHCRLITLVGSGGAGKTRLALEIAPRVHNTFPDGVFFIALNLWKTRNQILTALQDKLRINIQSQKDFQPQIMNYLQDKAMLLIFDNFESAIPEAELVTEILQATDQVKIMATSREPLNLQEEWIQRIQGLACAVDETTSLEDIQHYDAVRLFAERAAQVGYRIDSIDKLNNAVQICCMVGGIPLAIEMAASWLQFLSAADIAERLKNSIDLLTTRLSNIPQRHRSMRTVLEESWDLLTDEEKEHLLSLSIFNASFKPERAAQIFCIDLLSLSALAGKSLLQVTEDGNFQFHEMVRLFIQEKLAAQPKKLLEIEGKFCSFYAAFTRANEPIIKGKGQKEGLDEIEKEFKNIQSAWYRAIRRREFEVVDKMLVGLNHFCFMRGYAPAYQEMVETALHWLAPKEKEEPHAVWGKLLSHQDFSRKNITGVRSMVETSLQIARRENHVGETARSLFALGRVAAVQGDFQNAQHYYQESLLAYQNWGDPFYIAFMLSHIGRQYLTLAAFNDAVVHLDQSLTINRQTGNLWGEAYCLENLAVAYFNSGKFVEAYQNHVKANLIYQELDMRPALAYSDARLGSYSLFNGDFPEARQRCKTAQIQAKKIGYKETEHFAQTLLGILECLEVENYAAGQQMVVTPSDPVSDASFRFIAMWGSSLVSLGLGDFDASKTAIREALAIMIGLKNQPMVLFCFPICAAVLFEEELNEPAKQLLAASMDHPLSPNKWIEKAAFTRNIFAKLEVKPSGSGYGKILPAHTSADPAALANLFLELTSPRPYLKQQAISAANQDESAKFSMNGLAEHLTKREMEVLRLLSQGYTNRKIADELFISLGTAKTHIHNIYAKLDVSNRVQAIEKAKKLSTS